MVKFTCGVHDLWRILVILDKPLTYNIVVNLFLLYIQDSLQMISIKPCIGLKVWILSTIHKDPTVWSQVFSITSTVFGTWFLQKLSMDTDYFHPPALVLPWQKELPVCLRSIQLHSILSSKTGTCSRQSLLGLDSCINCLWTPITTISRHQSSCNKQNDVYDPPNPQSTKGQKLANCCRDVTHAESVYSKEPQEDGKYQGTDEVLTFKSERQRENFYIVTYIIHSVNNETSSR